MMLLKDITECKSEMLTTLSVNEPVIRLMFRNLW